VVPSPPNEEPIKTVSELDDDKDTVLTRIFNHSNLWYRIQTLGEPDVNMINHNPTLHHDINNDRDLHFRPILVGEGEEASISFMRDYWRSKYEEKTRLQIRKVRRSNRTET